MDTIGRPTIEEERPSGSRAGDALLGSLLDGRYRILTRLGEGGMGLVYEAKHEILGTRVAIKVLRADAAGDDESLARFEREAQSASAIGNEHIVDVRDFGRLPDGGTYVVMELIEGVDLLTELRREPLSWERASRVAMQICEALGAAHDAGIVHRDLKPENVLLTVRKGTPDFVKIVDFGIAKVMDGGKQLTAAGRVIGTPEYMAPEQCAGRTVDRRTDVYALGILLYEMTTGKLPFAHPDLAQLVRMQMIEKPVPPSKARPEAELPLAFEAVVLRCLAKDPDQRFGSMRDVSAALERALGGSGEVEPFEEREREVGTPGGLDRTMFASTPGTSPTPASTSSEVPAVVPRATPARGSAEGPRGSRAQVVVGVVAVLLGVAGGAAWILDGGSPVAPTETSAGATMDPQPEEPAPAAVAPEPVEAPADEEPSTEPVAAVGPEEIQLESDPRGAEVWQGDALLGNTPMSVVRPPEGERLELVLRHGSFRDHVVSLSHLSAPRLRLVLERASRSRPPSTGAPSTAPEETAAPPATTRENPRNGEHQPGFIDPWQ